MSARVVVPERRDDGGLTYHLPAGPPDDAVMWRPILCGGGIAMPHEDRRPLNDVCTDCRAAARRGKAAG
jgi:hypothetical protein